MYAGMMLSAVSIHGKLLSCPHLCAAFAKLHHIAMMPSQIQSLALNNSNKTTSGAWQSRCRKEASLHTKTGCRAAEEQLDMQVHR